MKFNLFLKFRVGACSWLFLICVISCWGPAQAQSNTIVVDGKSYEISLYQGQSFDANATTLRSSPWWGSVFLANDFANAYSTQVGVQDSTAGLDSIYFSFGEGSFDFGGQSIPTVDSMLIDETGGSASFKSSAAGYPVSSVSFAYATLAPDAASVPEINASSLSQVLLILFSLWLIVRRGETSTRARSVQ